MQFEYTANFEEFREVVSPKTLGQKPLNPLTASLSWMSLFAICVLGAIYHQDSGLPYLAAAIQPEPQNLWVTLAPTLYLSTLGLLPLVRGSWNILSRGNNSSDSKTPPKSTRQLLALLPGIWIVLAVVPAFAIEWRPRQVQMLWAGFAPLMLYFGIFAFFNTRQKNRAIRQRWEKKSTRQLPTRVEVTPIGISTDNGLVAHRYGWQYFKRYGESENLLLLITVEDRILHFPKRAVPDHQSMDELKMLISNNIAEGDFAAERAGFPVIFAPVDAVQPD